MNLEKVSKQLKRNNKWIKKCAGLLKANLKATLKLKHGVSSVTSSPSRKKKMIHDKGECVKCGKSVSLTKEGFIHKGHSPCEGSGQLPKHAVEEKEEEEKEEESSASSSGGESSEVSDEEESDTCEEKEEKKKEE
jgi:hypothetical protein